MDGIILTCPVGSAGGGSSVPVEISISPMTTVDAVTSELDPCPSAKWFVTAHNLANDEVRSLQVNAIHDFNGNVHFNCYAMLGDSDDLKVEAVAGVAPNTVTLQIENMSATDTIDVCVFRIV